MNRATRSKQWADKEAAAARKRERERADHAQRKERRALDLVSIATSQLKHALRRGRERHNLTPDQHESAVKDARDGHCIRMHSIGHRTVMGIVVPGVGPLRAVFDNETKEIVTWLP